MEDTKKFPKVSLVFLPPLRNSVAQVEGLTWYTGAISNAEWEGVALRDVLEYVSWLGKSVEDFGPFLRTVLMVFPWVEPCSYAVSLNQLEKILLCLKYV